MDGAADEPDPLGQPDQSGARTDERAKCAARRLRLASVQAEGVASSSREKSSRPRPRELSELGRLLAAADGYAVVDAAGRQLGRVDRVRYERHTDRPDEVVVRRGWLWKREQVVPLEAIEAVDRASGTIRLRPPAAAD